MIQKHNTDFVYPTFQAFSFFSSAALLGIFQWVFFTDVWKDHVFVFGLSGLAYCILFPIVLVLLGVFYFRGTAIMPSRKLAHWHGFITIATSWLWVATIYLGLHPCMEIKKHHETIGLFLQLLIMIFVLSQSLLVINLCMGVHHNRMYFPGAPK